MPAYTGGAQQMRAWYGNAFFFKDPRTQPDFKDWINHVLTRINPLTHLAYRMAFASLLLGAGGILEPAFALIGIQIREINGFTSGWVAAAYLEAVLIVSTILRAINAEVPCFGALLGNRLPPG
jgi:hypothetical protein